MDSGHWILNEGVVITQETFGFIYLIINTINSKKYIGKKQLFSKTTKPPLKGKKRKRIEYKKSDYEKYYGSSEELKKDSDVVVENETGKPVKDGQKPVEENKDAPKEDLKPTGESATGQTMQQDIDRTILTATVFDILSAPLIPAASALTTTPKHPAPNCGPDWKEQT